MLTLHHIDTALLCTASHEEDNSLEEKSNEGTVLEHQHQLSTSSLITDISSKPVVSDLKSLQETSTTRSCLGTETPSIVSKSSVEHFKESSEFYNSSFQFDQQQTHRTVVPNLTVNTPILTSLACSVTSFSLGTPFTEIRASSSDQNPFMPVYSKPFSHQEQSTHSQLSNDIVPTETHIMETVLASDLQGTQDTLYKHRISEQSSEVTDDKLKEVNLEAKPKLVRAESLDSDGEFFDCCQTLSEESETENKPDELLDLDDVYKVEEPPSLSNTPRVLVRERHDSQRPISWGSEEFDLPIVFEPEDVCVGEHDEELAYPYGYAGEHSFAEELPARGDAQYDDDDEDSLGRVSF